MELPETSLFMTYLLRFDPGSETGTVSRLGWIKDIIDRSSFWQRPVLVSHCWGVGRRLRIYLKEHLRLGVRVAAKVAAASSR